MTRRPLRMALMLAAAAALAVTIAVAGLLAGTSRHGSSQPPPAQGSASSGFQGAALPPGVQAPRFSLTDERGRRVSLASYRGRVVVLAFIYAGCTPACVLVAQQIRGALDDLARPVPVLIVSVAPTADTPARVSAFLHDVSLVGRVRYLVGPRSSLPGVWSAYRITTPSAGRAAFERAATVLLVDRQGRERVIFQQEQLTPEGLAHDIGKLQAG